MKSVPQWLQDGGFESIAGDVFGDREKLYEVFNFVGDQMEIYAVLGRFPLLTT
jgi:hypothetical protein